jgi:hypothetical protein
MLPGMILNSEEQKLQHRFWIRIRIPIDPHYFWKLDPNQDPHLSKKLDPDAGPH